MHGFVYGLKQEVKKSQRILFDVSKSRTSLDCTDCYLRGMRRRLCAPCNFRVYGKLGISVILITILQRIGAHKCNIEFCFVSRITYCRNKKTPGSHYDAIVKSKQGSIDRYVVYK